VAGSEPVTSPDQHKPGHRKAGRIGAIVIALLLVAMIFRNNDVSGIAKLWLLGIAAGLVAIVIGDAVLRRNGLRS
jgi:ABC-type branched-subunit amino acid transport system permease subunit